MNSLHHSTNSDNWEQTIANSGYTYAEVERYMKESYNQGYNDKDDEIKERISEIFESNRELTDKITRDLFNHLKSLNITPITAYLKVETIFSYSIMVTVSLEDYISDSLLRAYEWTSEIEKVTRNANFGIDIGFMYSDDNLNIDCLNSDGYRFKFKTPSETK